MKNEKISWFAPAITLVASILLVFATLGKLENGEHAKAVVSSFLAGADLMLSIFLFMVIRIFKDDD